MNTSHFADRFGKLVPRRFAPTVPMLASLFLLVNGVLLSLYPYAVLRIAGAFLIFVSIQIVLWDLGIRAEILGTNVWLDEQSEESHAAVKPAGEQERPEEEEYEWGLLIQHFRQTVEAARRDLESDLVETGRLKKASREMQRFSSAGLHDPNLALIRTFSRLETALLSLADESGEEFVSVVSPPRTISKREGSVPDSLLEAYTTMAYIRDSVVHGSLPPPDRKDLVKLMDLARTLEKFFLIYPRRVDENNKQ